MSGEAFTVSYTLHNHNVFVQEFESKLSPVDDFVFSGKRLVSKGKFLIFQMCMNMNYVDAFVYSSAL